MIIYWPNKQSINLNLAVAELFVQTYQKFHVFTYKQSTTNLPIDILNSLAKKQLFIEILAEIEMMILDITEINLSVQNIQKLNNRILHEVITTSTNQFVNKLANKNHNVLINYSSIYCKSFFNEHKVIVHYLLTYLIFGSSQIDSNQFLFYHLKTPFNHVKLLLENIIIQISNFIVFNIIEQYSSIQNIHEFFTKNHICNLKYNSIRAISNFRNNLISYNWAHLYIYYPQNIYCSNYAIFFLNPRGIIYKNIYFTRTYDYFTLSKLQLLAIIYLEIQDFIIPKINKIIILLGQLIIYILGNLISKSWKIFATAIIKKINKSSN